MLVQGQRWTTSVIRLSVVGGLSIALASCASVASESNGAGTHDAGPYPSNYEEIVKRYLHDTLKDPQSIQELTMSKPVEKKVFMGALGGGTVPAWATCVSYNAKNSYGGYTGIKSYTYYLRNGAILISDLGLPQVKEASSQMFGGERPDCEH